MIVSKSVFLLNSVKLEFYCHFTFNCQVLKLVLFVSMTNLEFYTKIFLFIHLVVGRFYFFCEIFVKF